MRWWALVVMAGCVAEEVPEPHPVLEPPAEGEGFQVSMETVAPALSEIWTCVVYPMPTSELSQVNRVEYLQNPGTHHMTLSTTLVPGILEPGTYDCDDLYLELMNDQIMIFGAQGDASGVMQLPTGVAAAVPADILVMHEIHYVNPTQEDVDIYSYVNGYTIPDEEVVAGIWGGQVRDETLEIPPGGTHTEWTRCEMNEPVEVIFLASHMHGQGVEFTIAPFDGETVGEVFYRNDDWHNPKIVQYDPPLALGVGEGFEYSCTWRNDTDETIRYGLTAEDEMCNLTLVHMPFSVTARCEVVATSDGVLWSP